MLIRYGFDIGIQLWQPTTLVTTMDVHASQREAITWESGFELSNGARAETFFDDEGNKLRRLTAGPGLLGMKLEGIAKHSGALDDRDPGAEVTPVEDLPRDALPYLWASRYCETDLLSNFAWSAFD